MKKRGAGDFAEAVAGRRGGAACGERGVVRRKPGQAGLRPGRGRGHKVRRRQRQRPADGRLGGGGPQAGPPPLPATPTAEQLRTAAIHSNYRALIDVTEGGGFGRLYGPLVEPTTADAAGKIFGAEYLAYARGRSGDQNITLMAQIPDAFDPRAGPASSPRPPRARGGSTGRSARRGSGASSGAARSPTRTRAPASAPTTSGATPSTACGASGPTPTPPASSPPSPPTSRTPSAPPSTRGARTAGPGSTPIPGATRRPTGTSTSCCRCASRCGR